MGLYRDQLPGLVMGKSLPFSEAIPKPTNPLAPPYCATPEIIRKNWDRIPSGGEVDLACSAFGGKIVSASNEHYGPAAQAISPYPPLHMFDGSESARSRVPGHSENVIIGLAKSAHVHRIEIDFTYYRNNNPVALSIDGLVGGNWRSLALKTPVKAYAGNTIQFLIEETSAVSEVKVTVYPDGGMNRVRIFGRTA